MSWTYSKDPNLFKKHLRERYGSKIKLLGPYKRWNEPIPYVCHNGHEGLKKPDHLLRRGCAECSGLKRKTQKEYNQQVADKHNDKITVLGRYVNDSIKVELQCKKCEHIWLSAPGDTIRGGCGCPVCANKRRRKQPHKLNTEQYLSRLQEFESYLVPETKINGLNKLVWHKCKGCSERIKVRPEHVLRFKKDCTRCRKAFKGAPFSNVALEWLEYEAKQRKIKIRHARNGGEHKIEGTRQKVDGYCKKHKIVFEFLGDVWHGNPDRFEWDDYCHPFKEATTEELFSTTFERLKGLVNKGYRVIYIWESSWKKGKPSRELTTRSRTLRRD